MSKYNPFHFHGLRRQWLFNTIVPIALLLSLIVALFAFAVSGYYYSSIRKGLEVKARVAGEFFNSYSVSSYSEYYKMASNYADKFEDKNRIEVQFINTNGHIQVSTFGLNTGMSPNTTDIEQVISNGEMGAFQGKDPETREAVSSVSYPVSLNHRFVGVIRFVTSLEAVNQQITLTTLAFAGIAFLCLLLVVVSNLLFINNVVEPVAVVSEVAKRIANGSYGIQLENKYTGELGELVDNINDMSLQIGQSEKMKTEFISSVSHELRTPLTAINGWGETLLADDGEDRVQTKRGIQIMVNESSRLTTMVEELLAFSRMENGHFTLQMEPVDVQAEIEDAIFTYRQLFRQEGIQLEYKDDGDLLPPVSGDPERLKQVFFNVLDNAAKHGGAGKRIATSVTRENNMAVVQVRDFGPGIPEAELPFVKKKFYKGSSKARGSGIGLAVCDEIVSLHGGTFTIGNAEGGGAVVTIALPISEG